MSDFLRVGFEAMMRQFAADHDWKISDLNDRRAIFKFRMDSGRLQTAFVIRYDHTLEFSVPSGAQYDDADDVPGFLSALLLQRSAEAKVGFWCLEKINDKLTFSVMHNAEIELINSEYFRRVVNRLVNECDDFEGVLLKLLDE